MSLFIESRIDIQKELPMHKPVIACLTIATLGLTLPAKALPVQPDARREIQDILRKSYDSIQRKDIAGCMAGFTQDFQGISIKGEHYNRKQTKQNLIQAFSYAQSITAKTTLKSITFVRGNALVIAQEHTKLTILGKRTHRLHTLVFDGLWQSVLVDTQTGWKWKSEKQLTSTVTRDGVSRVVTPTSPK